MATIKAPTNILKDEDVLFFYKEILIPCKNRDNKDVINIGKENGVTIVFADSSKEETKSKKITPKPKSLYPKEKNTIFIYKNEQRGNTKSFFAHCRNAFAHQYVKIEDDTLWILDWDPFDGGSKKKNFSFSRITMHGYVDYASFKNIINELNKKI